MADGGPEGSQKEAPQDFQVVKSTAAILKRLLVLPRAIEKFDKALELTANDKNCLVARSKCHLALGDTKKALQDAEQSLADNKKYHRGLFQKAEAMYYKGDFEMALVFYHRGHKLRPELQEFRLGIQKAQEAIENSVGTPDRVKLTTSGDLSFFTADDSKKKKRPGNLARPPSHHNKQDRRASAREAHNEQTIKEMLGELYGDRKYLEKLLKEQGVCAITRLVDVKGITDQANKTSRQIFDLAEEGLSYLDTRTDFWRQQKPMYARRFERNAMKRKYSSKKQISDDYIINELEKIDEAQSVSKYKESLKRAQNCLTTVDGYSEAQLSNKMALKAQLHSCMGNAYLELGQYDKALYHHQEDYHIGEKYDSEEAMSRGLDNLGRVYARMGEFGMAIKVWENKVPMSKTPIETTWLCHEIGRCYLELEKAEKAKDYGERSLAAAELADDKMWQLHASVLIAQAEVKEKSYTAAYTSFERALELAKVVEDGAAEAAIKTAMDEVNEIIVKQIKEEQEFEGRRASKTNSEEMKKDDSRRKSKGDVLRKQSDASRIQSDASRVQSDASRVQSDASRVQSTEEEDSSKHQNSSRVRIQEDPK